MDIQIGSNAIYTASMQVFNYRVDVGGVTIYRGRAIASPSGRVTVNVSNIVEDYLNSDEFPKRNVEPILYSEDGGYVKARLYRINADETTTLAGEYGFLRSYDIDWSAGIYDSREEVWTGQSITMSNPINGRLDPRMQQLYTVYRRTSGETISWGIVPKFRIIPDKIIAGPDGGTYTLIIEANVPFTATTDSGWISISGSGNTYVVTVTPNSGEDRNGGIILSYLDENDNPATADIPVVQQALSASIIPESIDFGPDGGESRFTVISNVDVTPTTSADWLTFVPVRTGDGFVTYKLVAVSNRDNTEGRTATINARGAVLTVNQEAFAVSVVIDKTEYNWEGDEGTLTVTANGSYEISTDVDWIRISPNKGYSGITEFNIIVDENETDFDRVGHIIVDGNYIEIKQETSVPQPAFITPLGRTFRHSGGTYTFMVTDEDLAGWSISENSEWFSISQSEGTGSTGVTVVVEANEGASRKASMSFTSMSAETEVNIRQSSSSYTGNYVAIDVISGGTLNWQVYAAAGTEATATTKTISYSLDEGETWNELIATTGGTSLNLQSGDILTLKGVNSSYSDPSQPSSLYATSFDGSTAKYNISGNILSLIYGDDFPGETSLETAMAFYRLFANTNVIDASNLVLPAGALTRSCCDAMFANCTSLLYPPQMLSTQLAQQCYEQMFSGCTSMEVTPVLPATKVVNRCYRRMFENCTSLTSTPQLPATTLGIYCYDYMFSGCTSLTGTTELPATTMVERCYNGMFAKCTSLQTAPDLLASNMYNYCYAYMFDGCSSLSYIKCLATLFASYATTNWVRGVSSSGTFVVAESQEPYWGRGNSGIPTNWTIIKV